MSDSPNIPLCRSEYLQDITIEIGRRFNPKHNPWAHFAAERELCQEDEHECERLSFWARTWYGPCGAMALWDDGSLWIGLALPEGPNNAEYRVGFYPVGINYPPARIAEAFRDTMAVATRLCYGESPLPLMRKIWNYDGPAKISGTLKRGKAFHAAVNQAKAA